MANVQFTLRSANGTTASGAVEESSLRQLYEAGSGGLLAAQFCSDVGSSNKDLNIELPTALDKITVDAVLDTLLGFLAHGGAKEPQQFQVRVRHGVEVAPFMAALDFLQVPLGDGPSFETVASKWQYQARCHLEEIGKELVKSFLEPALLNAMNYGPSSRTAILFLCSPKSVYHDGQDILKHCDGMQNDANCLVFASVKVKRPRESGVKFYRMYAVLDGCNAVKVLVENEVLWDDNFDSLVAELFRGSFQRSVFRDVLTSFPAFKGLGVQVPEDEETVIFLAPWTA
jgi:hypothetical protein